MDEPTTTRPNGKYKLTFAGGYGGTDGIIQTGIGPFDITGLGLSYGTVRFTKNAFKASFFTNILDGDASALLAVGLNGQPVLFTFKTQTYDFEAGNINTIGTRNVVSYGGSVRFNNFDLSIAPLGYGSAGTWRLRPGRDLLQPVRALEPRRAPGQVVEHRSRRVLAAGGGDLQAAARSRRSACRTTRRTVRRR